MSFPQSLDHFSPMIVSASSGKSQLGRSVVGSIEDACAAPVEEVLRSSETRWECRLGIFPDEGSAHRN